MVSAAGVHVSCEDFSSSLEFFTSSPLNFLVESIFPADDPSEATLVAHGLRIYLTRDGQEDTTTLYLQLSQEGDVMDTSEDVLSGPNGTTIRILPPEPVPVTRPELVPATVVTHLPEEKADDQVDDNSSSCWSVGRAGMRYRDLVPGRLGGRYIASHIHIPQGGPVPDYCHYHHIHFQMIFCYKGWVEVVYEDQGSPFLLQPGDCVLQPPRIRHRVLEASDNLEVIEIGSPAVHKTMRDFNITLPNEIINETRLFDGQNFLRHVQSDWMSKPNRGFQPSSLWEDTCVAKSCWEVRDTGMHEATNGIAAARVLRQQSNTVANKNKVCKFSPSSEIFLIFIMRGSLECCIENKQHLMSPGSCAVIPAGGTIDIIDWSDDVEVLEVQVYH